MKTNIDPNGLSEKLMCKLIGSKLIDRKKAQHILLARSAHLEKETIRELVEYSSLPGNNITSLEIASILEDNKILTNLIRSITKPSKYFWLMLANLLRENWVSPENVVLILESSIPNSMPHLEEVFDAQSKIPLQNRLLDVSMAICNSRFMRGFEKIYFWDLTRKNLESKRKGIFDTLPHEFFAAGRKVVKEEFERLGIQDSNWLTVAIQTYALDLAFSSPLWKKMKQEEREICVSASGIPWNNLVMENKGLGIIRWQEMKKEERYKWIKKESEKIPNHEYNRLSWSLFMYEIDALKRKKFFTKQSLRSLMEFIERNDGTNGLVYNMQFAGEGKELFNELPHEKQFELVFKAPLPEKAARVLVNYCTLTFKEWLKLWKKFEDIPKDLIISNTKWELESPKMLKEACRIL